MSSTHVANETAKDTAKEVKAEHQAGRMEADREERKKVVKGRSKYFPERTTTNQRKILLFRNDSFVGCCDSGNSTGGVCAGCSDKIRKGVHQGRK